MTGQFGSSNKQRSKSFLGVRGRWGGREKCRLQHFWALCLDSTSTYCQKSTSKKFVHKSIEI